MPGPPGPLLPLPGQALGPNALRSVVVQLGGQVNDLKRKLRASQQHERRIVARLEKQIKDLQEQLLRTWQAA